MARYKKFNEFVTEGKMSGQLAGDSAEQIAKELDYYVELMPASSTGYNKKTVFKIKNNKKSVMVVKMLKDIYGIKSKIDSKSFYPTDTVVFDNDQIIESLNNESINEGKMPSKFVGNDNIVYIKTKEDSKGANYNLYYKGHDIDASGRRFSSEKELKDFAANYILSNQWYNKLKWEKEKPLPKAIDESLDEALKVDHKEPGKKKVNIMVGRFQPPTLGHLKVLKAISKENGHPVIVLTVRAKKVDKTKTPFETETIEMMFNDLAKKYDFVEGIRVIDAAAIDKIFNELRPEYEPILWGTGTDRLKGYSRQVEKEEYRKDLGVDDAFGMYEIKRDEDNISASKVRAAIKADDEKLFQSMVDKALHGYFPELKTQLEDK